MILQKFIYSSILRSNLSLGYLSIEGVKNIAENAKCNFCTGCFTGEYPIRVPKEMPKDKFERKIDE